jgi:hypothetical protein
VTLEPIVFTDRVRIEFPEAHDTPWATMHRDSLQVELGPVHDDHDLTFVLTVAAELLMESISWSDRWRSEDGKERYVLIGDWILVARSESGVEHYQYDNPLEARAAFAQRTGVPNGTS